jgi:hypothetical protein
MSTAHIALTVVGGTLEIGGAVLIASADLVPRLGWARAAAGRVAARTAAKIRAVLRIRRDVTIHAGTAHATATMSGRVSAVTGVGADATLERKLDFLLDQARASQERLNEVERLLETVPAELRAEAAQQRLELEQRIGEELARREQRYDRQRFWGIMLVAAGGVLLAAANLVA